MQTSSPSPNKKMSSVMAHRFLRDSVALSRDGVQTVRRVVVSQWDRESVLRNWTPFIVLFGWLILGMLVFYAVESPAETSRHRALLLSRNAAKIVQQQQQAAEDAVSIDAYVGRLGASVEEQTLVIDMSGGNNNNIIGSGELSSSESNISNNNNDKFELNGNIVRQFNRKFYYGLKDLDVIAVKISRPAPAAIGQYLTLTVFYTNRTTKQTSRCHNDTSSWAEIAENYKWDLTGSLFFCLAVVTTIGYGNLAPSTSHGKLLCVLYAMIGVPLFLVVVGQMRRMLIRYASRFHKLLYRLAQSFERHSQDILERSAQFYPRMQQNRGRSLSRTPSAVARHQVEVARTEVRAATGVVSIVCCLMFIFLPSIFFTHAEGWDYLSSLYYSFISLTTIGFGDFIAGQKNDGEFSYGIYRVFLCVWLFFGIAFVATLTHVMQTLVERVIERIHWQRANKGRALKTGLSRFSRGNSAAGTTTTSNTLPEELSVPVNSVNLLDIIDTDILADLSSTLPNNNNNNNNSKSPSPPGSLTPNKMSPLPKTDEEEEEEKV